MKTVNDSLAAIGVRGKVGNIVFKKYCHGTIVSKYPDMSKAGCSVMQKKQRNDFAKAVLQAKEIMKNPDRKRYYASLPGKGSVWNKLLAELMRT